MENKAKIEIKLEEVVQTLPSSPSAQSPAGPAQAQPQPVNTYYDAQGRKVGSADLSRPPDGITTYEPSPSTPRPNHGTAYDPNYVTSDGSRLSHPPRSRQSDEYVDPVLGPQSHRTYQDSVYGVSASDLVTKSLAYKTSPEDIDVVTGRSRDSGPSRDPVYGVSAVDVISKALNYKTSSDDVDPITGVNRSRRGAYHDPVYGTAGGGPLNRSAGGPDPQNGRPIQGIDYVAPTQPMSEKDRKQAYAVQNDWVAKWLQGTAQNFGYGRGKGGGNPFLESPQVFDPRNSPSGGSGGPSGPGGPTTTTSPGNTGGPGNVAGGAMVAARTANTWSNGATQALSKLGSVMGAAAGPIGIFVAGVTAAAVAAYGLAKAAEAFDNYVNQRAKTLAPFSATLSMGQAQNQVVDIMSNYRRAQRLEDELVKYIRSSNETSNAIKDLKDELLKAILPLVNQVSGPVSDLLTLSAEGWRNINDGGFPEKLEGIVNILAKIAGFGAIIPPGFWEEIRAAAEFIRQERDQKAITIIDNILNNVELRNAPFAPFQPDPQAPRPPAMGAF